MKRVLLITTSLDRSGTAKQMTSLATRLPSSEFEVHVCALRHDGPFADDLRRAQIPLTVIGQRSSLDPVALRRLEQHVQHLRPDVVHTWDSSANTHGRIAALLAGAGRLVVSQRSIEPQKHRAFLHRYLRQRTQAIVVNSPCVQADCATHGWPVEKISVIPDGVTSATPSDTSREDLLTELELPSDARLIGLVARLWPQKRLKTVIWTLDILRCIRDDLHLLVIGDGPQRWRLERFSRLCTLDTHVHFLGQRHDVPRLLPHLDVLWHGSNREGMSNALTEAMAAGVPVIASDTPGNRELVVPGESGFLVQIGDRAGMARHANKLINDNELRGRIGNAARERMATLFPVDQMIDRHAALYRTLFAG